jgi:hypothetical protein
MKRSKAQNTNEGHIQYDPLITASQNEAVCMNLHLLSAFGVEISSHQEYTRFCGSKKSQGRINPTLTGRQGSECRRRPRMLQCEQDEVTL